MRTLTVTADDFGASEDVNAAVVEAHHYGIVNAASLLVTGDAWRNAVTLAYANPLLSVGLHLALVDGRAVLAPREIPHLVDGEGRFERSPLRAGLRYQFARSAKAELTREIRAQLERFRGTGLHLSHVDGHHHLHLHPLVLGVLADLAAEFAIPAIRLPDEELGTALALDGRLPIQRVAYRAIFRLLRRHGVRRLRGSGVGYSDRVYGLFATGRIDEEYLVRLLPRMRGNRVELYAHPSRSVHGGGTRELAALRSPRVQDVLAASEFRR